MRPAMIWVTGARGAIGREVVRAAQSRGWRVAGLGHGAWSGDNDLPPIHHWLTGDVDGDNLSALVRSSGPPDVIVHLAGGSAVGPSLSQPGEDFRRTVVSAQALFEWARTTAPDVRIALASTAAVYGAGHAQPIAETAPIAPMSPYGAHKAMVEMLARSTAMAFGLRIAIVRLFSVYGPGLRKQIVWDLATRLVSGERRIVLSGTGEEQRDFVEIGDAAAMLLAAADLADRSVPTLNGTSGRGTRIADLAARMAMRFDGADIKFSGERRAGDPVMLVGDATRTRGAGLSADTSLDVGLGRTLDWIEAQPQPTGRRL